MSTRNSRTAILLALSLLLLAGMACSIGGNGDVRVGELQNKSETVEVGEAESVRVELDMGAGELSVTGGAAALMEADFAYNVDEIEPEVTYSSGDLTVRQGDTDFSFTSLFQTDAYRNEWDLRFSDDVPMDMGINIGAGRSDLNLNTLSLSSLDVDSGAGELFLDLAGSSLTNLTLSMGAGEVTVDLTGDWADDLNATIDGGVGELTVQLPSGVGVRVDVSSGLGDINTGNLSQDGSYYVNDAYGESEVTLFITVNAGVGQVNLVTE